MRLATPVAFAVLLSMACSAFCQTSVSSHGNQHPRNLSASDYEQFVPYWTTESGWHSELQLRNNLPDHDLTVQPVLRTADGAEASLPAVTVSSEEVKSVDIGQSAPQFAGKYGSLVLRYHAVAPRGLYAAMMIRDMGHPIAFHLDAIAEAKDYKDVSREGIWWFPNETAADYLVITNQSADSIRIEISLSDAAGKRVKRAEMIGPRQTFRYSVRQLVRAAGLAGSYGGIRLLARAHEGSIDSVHFIFDEQAGFSALLKMIDHDPHATVEERDFARTGVWTLRAPMLALSQPDPALEFPPGTVLRPTIFLRNTTDKPVVADLRFNWRSQSATGKSEATTTALAPLETRRIDVAALQNTNIIPRNANWAAVMVTTKGLPNEIMAVAASYDVSLRYGAQTPFSDQLSFQWEGGRWEYDATHDSIITAGNGGTKPSRTAFTIFYNEGNKRYELEQTLQPDEQMWIDVGKLIRERVPDKNGNTLPVDLAEGSYEFRDLTDFGIGRLYEGKVIYDKTYGSVAYGCANCCAYRSLVMINDPLGIPLLGVSPNGVDADNTCGGEDNISGYFYDNWTTANHSIATVDSVGSHTGVAIGSTTSSTWGVIASYAPRSCPVIRNAPAPGGDNVAPCPTSVSVDLITPKSLPDYSYPTWLTGVGILARMKVGPASIDHTNAVLLESVTPTSDSCPSNIRQYTDIPTITQADSKPFVVGSSAAWEGNNYQSILNDFYDSHKLLVSINVLGLTSVQSCVAKATQTYYCNGSAIGTFTLTNTYTKGTVNGQGVTSVSITKQ